MAQNNVRLISAISKLEILLERRDRIFLHRNFLNVENAAVSFSSASKSQLKASTNFIGLHV